ncbi:tRNA (guanine-N(7)-)-methyltransferase non-catalytic subunit wuho [Drosophila sulfurigaster albostrigata]|uniref:tRNA (guanine-N(7)-)-methyltransferase non-catalytic subunit wuho n=1 Tax=Drosophila sulfurigaster albostrigata TaxID=89887 RepID=UPI002D21B1C6|nr:tRNA (guanine-N(7)-)-methyltransferase non-catalytic subunit wuho [Drosophila sulfurigaster albostrigata]
MTTIFYLEPELVLAHGRKVLFLNPNDLQIFKEIELPTDLTTCGLKPVAASEATEEQPATKSEVSILNVSYSPDRQLIALTTAGQKALLLYKSRPEHAKLLSIRPLARASSALRFAPDSSSLLVTDKTGDCYQFDCSADVEAPPKLLLGHLSIVYDILWTPDQQHIISCDRDDKIRVTNYPASYDIHSYCLGHKEFVSGLVLLGEQQLQHLVSVSGDKTLRIWKYATGEELLLKELPAPAVRLQLRELVPGQRYEAAVLFYDHSAAIGLYELQLNAADAANPSWSVTREQLIEAAAGSWHIGNFALCGQRIYVLGSLNDNLTLRAYSSQDGAEDATLPEGWLQMVGEQFAGEGQCVPEDLSVWFKKRYDNVSDYMERKKRRIEDTNKAK